MSEINYEATELQWDEATNKNIQMLVWKFRPSQKIWWWDHIHEELHPGVIIKALWDSGWDTKWQVEYDDLQLKVNGSDIYETKEEAIAHRLKVVNEQLNTLQYSTQKCKEAEARLLKLLEADNA